MVILYFSLANYYELNRVIEVNRSVDELYSHCEEQEDEQKCRDAIDLMVIYSVHL